MIIRFSDECFSLHGIIHIVRNYSPNSQTATRTFGSMIYTLASVLRRTFMGNDSCPNNNKKKKIAIYGCFEYARFSRFRSRQWFSIFPYNFRPFEARENLSRRPTRSCTYGIKSLKNILRIYTIETIPRATRSPRNAARVRPSRDPTSSHANIINNNENTLKKNKKTKKPSDGSLTYG